MSWLQPLPGLSGHGGFWTIDQRDDDQQQKLDENHDGVRCMPAGRRPTKREGVIWAGDKVKDTERKSDNSYEDRAIEK